MKNQTTDNPLLLTPQQAADALAISTRKLWEITSTDDIPHLRIGRCVRYSIQDLHQWIESRQTGGIQQ